MKFLNCFWGLLALCIALAATALAFQAPANAASEECRSVRKYRGNASVESVVCKGADGVWRERTSGAFRGTITYEGQFEGITQRISARRRQSLDLNNLLLDALGGGEPRLDAAGQARIQLQVEGRTARATVSGTGNVRFSFQLSGTVENGACVLSDERERAVLRGRCDGEAFAGSLESDPERGTRLEVDIVANATAAIDLAERELDQAAERQRQELADRQAREQETRWVELQTNLAEGGDVEAMNRLAHAYSGDAGFEYVPRDHVKRAMWLSRAADRGDATAMYILAFAYLEGEGVTRDHASAASLLRRCSGAADKIAPHCQSALGVQYWNGEGVTQNHDEALRLWRRCSAAGVDECRDRVARLGS